MNDNTCAVLATLVMLLAVQEPSEACSCYPLHPQTAYCKSQIVIKGKIVSSRKVMKNDYGFEQEWIEYGVEQIKVLKGNKDSKVQFLLTPPLGGLCGVEVSTDSKLEYVIAGTMENTNTLSASMCDLVKPWNSLTPMQKKGLLETYKQNCNCEVVACVSHPCSINPYECSWTDGQDYWDGWNGNEAQNLICSDSGNGQCNWK
ncbi:metalloproteinase inhibitor 2-like [Latimeria chalumnae]|uniref:metalloproteinase inhibitor 2-like n=1 Tax=Latimeria chalumnae TaxID=7897 RepID=UPI0003C159D1|nr:PREDICTED: metalloproteinase inhibitor 2-like [Latimeria chalumnae]XP_006012673.1 PREDICTED: metalloproteinase inhibitor 2-like [Latimeria chalumnae]XP_006012674.1 PREDICTED: metalloproteinase inhibitor 2-like [Latimeria chalumnae]|eukprot:XP_006012672.1 PREDICTED: metalloproteinase inhibitor 2-like [Latimeria chalumnae]